jgi:hypothetical protein
MRRDSWEIVRENANTTREMMIYATNMTALEDVLRDPSIPHDWSAIVLCFWELMRRESLGEEITLHEIDLLNRARDFNERINIQHPGNGPHSRPADFFMRSWADQILKNIAAWELQK